MSIAIADWSFLAIVITILLTPGPTNTLLATAGGAGGWRSSASLVPLECLGYLVATSLWGLLLRELLADYPVVLHLVKLVSAAYIAKLALDLLRKAGQPSAARAKPVIGGRQLFLATLLNPKAAIFAMVIFPVQTWLCTANYSQVMGCFIASVAIIGSLWIGFGAALVGGRLRWLSPARFMRLSAVLLLGFAAWLACNALFSQA